MGYPFNVRSRRLVLLRQGRRAAELLLARLNGHADALPPQVVFSPTLVVRDPTRRCA
jgi:DNA-binding LacI/PurR family transcriptional regulator